MRRLSGLLRILLGLGLMGVSGYVSLVHYEPLPGPHVIVSLNGQEVDIAPKAAAHQPAMIVGLGAAGILGLLLFGAGILTLLRKPTAPPPADPTTDGIPPARSS